MGILIGRQRRDLSSKGIDDDAESAVGDAYQSQPLLDCAERGHRDQLTIHPLPRHPAVVGQVDDGDALVVAPLVNDSGKEHLETKHRGERELSDQRPRFVGFRDSSPLGRFA